MLTPTVADDVCGGEVALETLRSAANRFVALGSAGRPRDLQESVDHGLHILCRAIEACEDAGLARREILAMLGPARALHACSPFIARAQAWPRGYAGDFETVEHLCDATNRAPAGTIGHALEEAALRSPITAQHRNKVAFQADAVLRTCLRKPAGARILSIGCGGCRDLRSIHQLLSDSRAEFVLCDFDYEALDLALHALGPLAERCTYLNATIPRVLPRLVPYGPFDLVLVGGVCDYLPDRWVTLTARSVWHNLLAPGGKMVLTNIKRGNPFRVWLDIWPTGNSSSVTKAISSAAAKTPASQSRPSPSVPTTRSSRCC